MIKSRITDPDILALTYTYHSCFVSKRDFKIFTRQLIRMAAKAKKELVIEVLPVKVTDRRIPVVDAPMISHDTYSHLKVFCSNFIILHF